MPKFSVYVPDHLWERVRDGHPGQKASQLVQEGLLHLVDGERDAAVAVGRPEGARERIRELLEGRLAAEARAEYERGYRGALDAAEVLPLEVIDAFARAGFDCKRWLEPYRQAELQSIINPPPKEWMAADYPWLGKVAETLGAIADPGDPDERSFWPTTRRVRGFRDGLRDVWMALEQGVPAAVPAEEGGGAVEMSDEQAP